MKAILLLFFLLIIFKSLAQDDLAIRPYDVSFEKTDTTIFVSRTKSTNFRFLIKISGTWQDPLLKHYLTVQPKLSESDILSKYYQVFFPSMELGKKVNTEIPFYITLEAGAISSGEHTIVLELYVNDEQKHSEGNNISNSVKMTVKIKLEEEKEVAINGYSYLGYFGTNFDLVDGIKAKNAFFAANIYLPPPLSKKRTGFYLSLYGNRTFSTTDSLYQIMRTAKIVGKGDSAIYYRELTDLSRNQVSDNIGAIFAPLFSMKKRSKLSQKQVLELYYSPSFEFIWRRTNVNLDYSNGTFLDSQIVQNIIPFNSVITMQNSIGFQYSEFDFNLGALSFLLEHENDKISVRISFGGGYQANFLPLSANLVEQNLSKTQYSINHNIYVAGRAWITLNKTGLTIQAEVSNRLFNSLPYYGVTLSKAVSLDKIYEYFQPLTKG